MYRKGIEVSLIFPFKLTLIIINNDFKDIRIGLHFASTNAFERL
jgi:hypothetical protein